MAIMLFLTFVARPVVSTVLLAPFRAPLRQIGMVSWAGLRGAASVVFAISAVLSGTQMRYDLYNLVFCIVLFSISVQGTLLSKVAKKLGMIDPNEDIGKTFNDYQEESDIQFIKLHLNPGHPWCGHTLSEFSFPSDLRVAMIARDQTTIVPDGNTRLKAGDLLVLAARAFEDRENLSLCEVVVDRKGKWVNMPLCDIPVPNRRMIILIKRGVETVIPTGDTVIRPGDVLVFAESAPVSEKK